MLVSCSADAAASEPTAVDLADMFRIAMLDKESQIHDTRAFPPRSLLPRDSAECVVGVAAVGAYLQAVSSIGVALPCSPKLYKAVGCAVVTSTTLV